MTATLSPVGTPIDMTVYEEHWDEQIPCLKGDAPATVRLVSRCCSYITAQCPTHLTLERAGFEARIDRGGARCKTCHHEYVAPDTWNDFMKVVPL